MFRTRSSQTPPLEVRPSAATLAAFAAAARPMLFDSDSDPADWHRYLAPAQRAFIAERDLEVTDAERAAAHAVAVSDIDTILRGTTRRGHAPIISDRTVTSHARDAAATTLGYVRTSTVVTQTLGAAAVVVLTALIAWSGWAGDVVDRAWPANTPVEQIRAALADGTTVILWCGAAFAVASVLIQLLIFATMGPHRRPHRAWRSWTVRIAAIVTTTGSLTTAAAVAYQIGTIAAYTY